MISRKKYTLIVVTDSGVKKHIQPGDILVLTQGADIQLNENEFAKASVTKKYDWDGRTLRPAR